LIAAEIVRMEGVRLAEHWDVLQNDATRANPRVDYLCSETLFRHGAPTLRVRPTRIAVEGPRSVYLLRYVRDRLRDSGRQFARRFQRR
jgi:hypothetical protein